MATRSAPVTWNNLRIEYVGELGFDYVLDSKDQKAKIQITNTGTTSVQDIYFQIAIEGVGDYPMINGDGGFAVFPNGGNIDLAPGESFIAQTWLQGVYETRFNNSPPAVGESKTYSFDFILVTDNRVFGDANPTSDPSVATKLTQDLVFTHSDMADGISGPQAVTGTITGVTHGTSIKVEIATPYSQWFRIPMAINGDTAQFDTSVVERDDWIVRVTGDGLTSQTSNVTAGQSINFALSSDTSTSPSFSVLSTDDSPVGFWKGAVSESEQTFVLIPGQENWAENWAQSSSIAEGTAIREASEIRKYDFNGNMLWSYKPGWECWGGDMSPDGSKVVYLVNPTENPYGSPDWELGMLDGANGHLLWRVTGSERWLEGLEASISSDASLVAAGGTPGALAVLDASDGSVLWEQGAGTYGQIRKLVFSGDSLYVGTGDSFLYKLDAATGDQVWKTWVGGWPFVMGFDISVDGRYIATGTKSKDTSVVDANTGELVWSHDTGALDAVFSPDGQYVANFAGDIFQTATGELVGQGNGGVVQFSSDSRFLVQADRGWVTVNDLTGAPVERYTDATDTEMGPGQQSQWIYLTEDGTRLIVASRDMDTPNERGLTVWSVTSGSSGANRVDMGGYAKAYDLDGNAGMVAKTLGAVFGSDAVANQTYVGIGLYYVDDLGYSYEQLMDLALDVVLGANPSNTQVVDLLYENVVGIPPADADRALFVGMLDRSEYSHASLGVLAADTSINTNNIDLVGLGQDGLAYLPFVG